MPTGDPQAGQEWIESATSDLQVKQRIMILTLYYAGGTGAWRA